MNGIKQTARLVGRSLTLSVLLLSCVYAQAQDRAIQIGTTGWKLWLDRTAEWKNDPLHVPPVNINRLKVNPPTCGWGGLFKKSLPLSEVNKVITDPALSLDVNVPGTVEEYCWDTLSGKGKGLGNSGNYEGVSWWGKDFDVSAQAKGKRVKLCFTGGIRQRAEVFVNQQLVGYELVHQTPFEIDITDVVKYGASNQLAVRITDANGNFSWGDYTGVLWGEYYFPLSHAFGGILDEVKLSIVNPVYVSDVFVKNKPELKDIDTEIEISNEGTDKLNGTFEVAIVENWKKNRPVSNPKTVFAKASAGTFTVAPGSTQTLNFAASVPQAHLWGIKDANLYDFIVTLKDGKGKVIDRFSRRFGFRFLSVEGYGTDARIYLNGKRTFLLSAISWGFWPTNGMYPTPELARKHIASAQVLGQNMLNFHRCQGNSIVLNLADEMGILYYEEPGGYSSSRTKADNPAVARAKNFEVATRLNSQRFLRMVRSHRNHPSLVIYNMVNEPGWSPDEQAKADMANAHLLDPTRCIFYGSGFMNPGEDEPQKLHMLPYDKKQYTLGYVDVHNAGNSPGVYVDAMYNTPKSFLRNDLSKGELFVWGEEGALASPPQLEKIQKDIARTGYNGWDGADYKDWYRAYADYIDKKNLKSYYPSMTNLITSLGDIMYYEHGRLVENARIADGTELYILNGFEDMKFDNFSGAVDVFRNLKGTPELISQYMRPLMVSVKCRDKIGEVGEVNQFDMYVLNEHTLAAGTYKVKAKVKKPDGTEEFVFAGEVNISGGDTFSDLVKSEIPVKLNGGKGYYYVTAQLLDGQGRKIADGHDELFAVDWKSDKLSGKGAVIGGDEMLAFARDVKGADVVPYSNSLGKLDYIVVGTVDNGTEYKPFSPASLRTKDAHTMGMNMEYYQGRNFDHLIDRRISTAKIDFDLKNKQIPGWDILGNSDFSLRWEGYIVAETTGKVDLTITYDDGARVWFDNEPVLDDWRNGPQKTKTFTVDFMKGKKYPVRMEAFQAGGTWLFSLKRKMPVQEDKLDVAGLIERVSKDGTQLLLLEDAETWVKKLREANVFPAHKVFHPAKTWVGHNFMVRQHPFFSDLPVNKGMNWEYQRLVVYDGISHFGLYDMEAGEEAVVSLVGGASHLISTSVGIVPLGKGSIVYSSLDLSPNLTLDVKAAHVPKKIYCNILRWAASKSDETNRK